MEERYLEYVELSEKLVHNDIMNKYQFENLSIRTQKKLIEDLKMTALQWRDCI